MKITGLITEYNPFHNGHQYHIQKALEVTKADGVIVVMSGDFVQRGAPAIMPKHMRTKVALKSGASLVIELPVCYATASAEAFAYGAVSLLHKLGCVESICFGSECGDINTLEEIADILVQEPNAYKEFLNQYLRKGCSYPLARQHAICDYLGQSEANSILSEPNNILGVEYIKALKRLQSPMKAYTIQRISSHYHDQDLQESFSSASAIRKALKEHENFVLKGQVPDDSIPLLETSYNQRYPIYANDFSLLLKYKLMGESKASLTRYADVSVELANRIFNQRNQFLNFDQFCEILKTKEVTYSRISRALLHILLDIKKEDMTEIAYARILGFRKQDTSMLSEIKQKNAIPIITKLGNASDLSKEATSMLQLDLASSNLYESVVTEKFQRPFITEFQKQIIIV